MNNYEEEFIFRTEDIKLNKLKDIFVETENDRENIEFLKRKSPGILIGSRGTGKTMLLRVAEKELDMEYEHKNVLGVFISFSKAILVDTSKDILYFRQWMFSKILLALKLKLARMGIGLSSPKIFSKYFGSNEDGDEIINKLTSVINVMENSWNDKNIDILPQLDSIFQVEASKIGVLRDVDYFKIMIEEVCETYGIDRITLLFDEACHNFIPIQQREFFTLFRDLRSPYISCKAAVYPGITSYGTFQAFHDAVVKKVERDINSPDYTIKMREIVKKQLGNEAYDMLIKNGDNFNTLIYASSGNPRLLLKSIYEATEELKSFKTSNVNTTIKSFYRTRVWNEHTKLGEIYKGHKDIIDWGRWFLENKVLIETINKNEKRLNDEKINQTIYFAIHRDAPIVVKQAMKILEYSGIVSLHTEGTKVRTEIYDRYQINFGVVLASEVKSTPVNRYKEIANNLSIKLFTDYGMNSYAYEGIEKLDYIESEESITAILDEILESSIDKLDLPYYQRNTLKEVGFLTIKDILKGKEQDLQKAYLIGPIRSRRIFNIALNATIEYISG
ncbi:TPA: hypothetical protein SOK46_000973 [Clostridioides difficile]|nr:hypothetical protein [Clostridioides difficile]HEK4595654.1 hypothetical protein [Clostridioides difficile]HEK4610938.1 hypothetical protein [Clostridioides difficile]HEK4614529.1 hypothetical protein [Clostridioides difficile]HEK4645487.1 hypothetical protein [Clostridioides difficile]